MNSKQLWRAALDRVRMRISAASYTTWFKATEGNELRPDELVVVVPNAFAAEHLRQRFSDVAGDALADVLGRHIPVTFVVRPRLRTSTGAVRSNALDTTEDVVPVVIASTGGGQATDLPSDASAASRRQTGGRAPVAPRASRHERRAVLDAPHSPQAPRSLHPPSARRTSTGRLAAQPAQPSLLSGLRATSQRDRTGRAADAAREAESNGNTPPSIALSAVPSPASSGTFPIDSASRYVFETFVVGTANRLAVTAAQQVAAGPGQSYNPLFIYGGTGLGKTHLLLAIGHVARQRGLSVCYVSAERFANDIIEAIRHHTTDEFRAHYRQVDVLLVDDIQFIAGKESTEEEFFHTFNALHDGDRQIVLSSDRTPKAMHRLHDRLRSRFEWGLLADIQPPDFEHRLDILRAKAAHERMHVPDEMLAAIARPECASVRELEGALHRVLAYAAMLRQPATPEMVGRALVPLRTTGPREVTSEQVLAVVMDHFGISAEALRGKSRDHATAWPRQVAMYLLREETPASLSQIGHDLGGRDHTTVMHGHAHVSKEAMAHEHVRRELDQLRAVLRGAGR